jgi:hypothetical protein
LLLATQQHFERVTRIAPSARFPQGFPFNVHKVTIVEDNRHVVNLYQERGAAIRKVQKARAEVLYCQHIQRAYEHSEARQSAQARETKAKKQMMRHKKQVEALNEQRAALPTVVGALCAYVSFDQEQGALSALATYPTSTVSWLVQRGSLRLRGHRLSIRRAPEPSTIIWENIGVPWTEGAKRKILSTFVVFLLLCFSAALSFMAKEYQQTAEREGGVQTCPAEWRSWDSTQKKEYATKGQGRAGNLYCYCSELSSIDQVNSELCDTYYFAQLAANAVTSGSSFGIAAINVILIVVMKRLAAFEKHSSKIEEETSTFIRVFGLQFINTGWIPLLVNSNWFLVNVFDLDLIGAKEFDFLWYETVGSSIQLTLLFGVLSPHVYSAISYYRHHRRFKRLAEGALGACLEQRDLNDAAVGPHFRFAVRWAEVLNTTFVVLMYGPGMPVLYLVAAATLAAGYWADKFFFTRYCRTPPHYDEQLGKSATKLIPWGLGLHLIMAIWMFGNSAAFTAKDYKGDYPVTQAIATFFGARGIVLEVAHVSSLLFLLALIVLGIILSWFKWSLSLVFAKVMTVLTCGKLNMSEFEKNLRRLNVQQIRYSVALGEDKEKLPADKVIKGLPTYEIIDNPSYREAFNVLGDQSIAEERQAQQKAKDNWQQSLQTQQQQRQELEDFDNDTVQQWYLANAEAAARGYFDPERAADLL